MGSDMYLRDLYLPAGTTVDLAAAKTTAGELCRTATIDDLRALCGLGCEGAVTGSAIWLGRFSLADALSLDA